MSQILIIDADAGMSHAVATILVEAEHTVFQAVKVSDALEILAREQIDLIIMDDNLPETGGGELCLQLKTQPQTRQIPVLFHTDSLRLFNEAYLKKIGADAVLRKPSPGFRLQVTVTMLLDHTVQGVSITNQNEPGVQGTTQ